MKPPRWKLILATGVVGMLVMSGVAIAQSPEEPRRDDNRGKRNGQRCDAKGPGPARMRVVHSETKVALEEGFANVIVDHGTVESVSEQTLTIKRRDSEVVKVTAGEGTRICRDGKEAKLSDLKKGDLAHAVQSDQSGETKVRAIRAFSPEFAEERKAGREEKRKGGRGPRSGKESGPRSEKPAA